MAPRRPTVTEREDLEERVFVLKEALRDLLAELERALEWLEIDPLAEERGVVADIRDAIAKARKAHGEVGR